MQIGELGFEPLRREPGGVRHGYQGRDEAGHRHGQARAPVQEAVDAVARRGDLLVSQGRGRTGHGHDQVSERRDERTQRVVDATAF